MLINYITFWLKNDGDFNVKIFSIIMCLEYNLYMGSKNYSSTKLSKYFLKMSDENREIPYMTEISKSTGVSNSTISRYAKKKGFYNFGEMRATFNKTLNSSFASIDTGGFDEIFKHKNIKIATSKSCKVISDFLQMRLRWRNIPIEIVDRDTVWNQDDFTLFVTLSGESESIKKYMSKSVGAKMVVSTRKSNLNKKGVQSVILPEYDFEIRNTFDVCNSIMKVMNWMNDVINIREIKEDNEKNRI